jgi:hypothetical protein
MPTLSHGSILNQLPVACREGRRRRRPGILTRRCPEVNANNDLGIIVSGCFSSAREVATMKTYIHATAVCTLAFFLGFALAGKNLIRNGDFEKFNGNDPAGWETTNLGKMLTVVSPSTKAHSGAYAVKCEVKASFGGTMPGMITQKKIALSGETLQLSLYYLLTSVGKDVGFLTVDFQNAEGSTVGMCEHYLTAVTSDFTLFKAAAKKPETASMCEFRLTLMPEKEGGKLHDGSSILVDDVELVSLTPSKDAPMP